MPFKDEEPVHFLGREETIHSQIFRATKKTETRLKLLTACPVEQVYESISDPKKKIVELSIKIQH